MFPREHEIQVLEHYFQTSLAPIWKKYIGYPKASYLTMTQITSIKMRIRIAVSELSWRLHSTDNELTCVVNTHSTRHLKKRSSLLIPEDSVDKEHLWKLQGNKDWNGYIKTTCWILQGNKRLIV